MRAIRSVAALCSVALAVQGCATASKDLTASYVSPLQYQSYDCEQLTAEIQRIQNRVVQLGGRLDEAANNDKGIMAVGLLIFWPALFALGGTKQQEAEYSRLKGEYDALEQQAVIKKCRPAPVVQATTTPAPPETIAVPLTSAPAPAPAVASVPAAVPQTVAPAVVVPAVLSTSVPGESRYMFAAERFARANGCVDPVAAMSLRSTGSEAFTITCARSDPMIVRCDYGACRVLQ